MKHFFWFTVALLAIIPSTVAEAENAARVTGQISIVELRTNRKLGDFSQVAVWLVPVGGDDRALQEAGHTPPEFVMLQRGKRFEPHLLAIPLGSRVKFPNLDPWFHNVFSLYRGKRFDLGLYQAGSEKTVQFDRPGTSYIFCNIHPQMSAVILAVNSRYIGVSDKAGNVSISGVPPGRYKLHLWYEFSADPDQLAPREIVVEDAGASFGTVTITAKEQRDERHTNKYGQEYDRDTVPDY